MKDIINDINVLIENTGYSINKNDVDIEQLKNINGRLKEIRTKLNLLTIPVVIGQSEQLKAFREWTRENLDEKDIVTKKAVDSYLESL